MPKTVHTYQKPKQKDTESSLIAVRMVTKIDLNCCSQHRPSKKIHQRRSPFRADTSQTQKVHPLL